MCCLRARETHLKVFVVCYIWSSPPGILCTWRWLWAFWPLLCLSLSRFSQNYCFVPHPPPLALVTCLTCSTGLDHTLPPHIPALLLFYTANEMVEETLTHTCTHMHTGHAQPLFVCVFFPPVSCTYFNMNAHRKKSHMLTQQPLKESVLGREAIQPGVVYLLCLLCEKWVDDWLSCH